MRRKVLVTGASGLVGTALREVGAEMPDLQLFALSRLKMNIADRSQVHAILEKIQPDVLINSAAYTDLERAELQPQLAYEVNSKGVENLASECRERRIKMIQLSTHGIFDGEKNAPYLESDIPNPLNEYAKSKRESEEIVQKLLPEELYAVVRLAWPLGKGGKGFFNKIIQTAREKGSVSVVIDQIGNPNPAPLIARKLLEFIDDFSGIFHLTCDGHCSKLDLIRFALEKLGIPCEIKPVLAKDYPAKALRPGYCVLGSMRNDLKKKVLMPTWQEALENHIDEFRSEL